MSKEIAKKATQEIAPISPEAQELMNLMPKAEPKDLSIPSILTVQSTSDFIEGEVKAGDIINAETLQVLGGNGKRLNFIPLTFFKSWQHFQRKDGAQKWIKEELYTGQTYPWNEITNDGVELVHDETYSFYVLLEQDLSNSMALPYLLKLKRTSAGEAKKLVTAIERAKSAHIEPWSLIFSIDTSKEKGEKGPYYVTTVNPVVDGTSIKRIAGEALTLSRDWAGTVIKNQKALNERKMAEPETPAAAANTAPPIKTANQVKSSGELPY